MKRQANNSNINKLTHHLFRENSGKMMGVLSKVFGIRHLDLISDAIQDTFETAIIRWRFSGIPANPTAWLMKVAKNKTINSIKRENKWDNTYTIDHYSQAETVELDLAEAVVVDSQLQLLLLCCRPELSTKNQIAITLNVLCGFGIAEIANALLMNEEAVKKALTRIKKQWKSSAISQSYYSFKTVEEINEPILLILYLMFNEGYKSTKDKKGINIDLCYEAIRLAKLLERDGKSGFEARSLLALMFFNIARFPARISQEGEWLTLEEQDRSLWDKKYIEEGFYYLRNRNSNRVLNAFYLEALIASIHCTALEYKNTDWKSIVFLYEKLQVVKPNNFVVQFNCIIAESFVYSPKQSIGKLNAFSQRDFKNYEFIYFAGLAYLHSKLANNTKALAMYRQSLTYANTKMDEVFISRKIEQLSV